MQRKREADLRAKLQEEQAKELKESHWVVSGNDGDLGTYVFLFLFLYSNPFPLLFKPFFLLHLFPRTPFLVRKN